MLDEKEISALRLGDFELHCLQMRIVQQSEPPSELNGTGTIRCLNNGQLEFTLLSPGLREIRGPSLRPVGEVIPSSEYFVLEATDVGGRTWRAAHLLPHIMATVPGNGYIASGLIGELSSVHELPTAHQHRHSITQYLFHDLTIPYNAQTVVRTTLAGLEGFSSSLDAVDITTSSARILIHRKDGVLLISATALHDHLPSHFEVRVIEALQFLLAEEISPSLVRSVAAQVERTRILAATTESPRYRGLPPIGRTRLADLNIPWHLFATYLDFVELDQSEHFSPLSREWAPIVASSGATLETQALLRAIAVESLCDLAVADGTTSVAIPSVTERLRSWSDRIRLMLRRSGCPEDLLMRYEGALGSMQQVRAIDKLYLLASRGRVDSDLIQAWKRLRNLVAHGVHDSGISFVELIRLNDAVLQLLHQLTFHIIGYQGPYVRYGQRNWPIGLYRHETQTSDPEPES